MAHQLLSVRDDKITVVHSFLSKMSILNREIKHGFFLGFTMGTYQFFFRSCDDGTASKWNFVLFDGKWERISKGDFGNCILFRM